MRRAKSIFLLRLFLEHFFLGPTGFNREESAKASKGIHAFNNIPGLGLILYFGLLYILPLNWAICWALHFAVSMAAALVRFKNVPVFVPIKKFDKERFHNSAWIGCLLVVPITFVFAFLIHFGKLTAGGLLQPADVYSYSLLWAAAAIPLGFLVGLILYNSKIPISLRTYASCLLVLIIILTSFVLLQSILQSFYSRFDIPTETGIFGNYNWEKNWRFSVKILLVLSYSFLFLGSLGHYYFRGLKMLKLTLTLILGMYLNSLLFTGELCLGLEHLRNWTYNHFQFKNYQIISAIQKSKFPQYVRIPYSQHELGEYLYQTGKLEKAENIFNEIVSGYSRSYVAPLKYEISSWLENWEKNKKLSGEITGHYLTLPIIQYADYLTANWCGVLTAMGFIQKISDDLSLKEKLLKVFTEGMDKLPPIDNLPALGPVLNRLDVPYSAAFLTDTVLIQLLSEKMVPLVYYNYTWIPIQGYDPLRDGFYFLDYSSHFNKYTRKMTSENLMVQTSNAHEKKELAQKLPKFCRFISREKIKRHLLDIGGIGVVIGENHWPDKHSAQAAYTIELGDMYYQSLNNIPKAYGNYLNAKNLKDNWVVRERIAFLKRHKQTKIKDVKKIGSVYVDKDKESEFFKYENEIDRETEARILSGRAGSIILEQWIIRNPVPDSAQLDSLREIYQYLHSTNPYKTSYLDSLVNIEYNLGNISNSLEYATSLYSLYPNGYSNLALKIAWMYLELNNMPMVEKWIPLAKGSFYKAKQLTLEGARNFSRGKIKKAEKKLEESLKEDKTLALSHFWMAKVYTSLGELQKAVMEKLWVARCKGEI